MEVALPFGRSHLTVELPDSAHVLRPAAVATLEQPEEALRASLRTPLAGPPLRELAAAGQRVAIVISDITRPVPNELILPPILAELEAAGIALDDVTIVNGTGLHRVNTDAELRAMLGETIASRYRIVQHEARRPDTLVEVGRTRRGEPALLCRAYVEADLRIVTGFVEPHLFAGYSGGAKGVMPGVAGASLIMSNHGAAHLSHPRSRFCQTQGNPVFEEMREVTALCPPHFLLNVTLDTQRRLTGVFAGDWLAAHDAAIEQAARQYRVDIGQPYDVVVATNMGHPADLNFYQSVKGMSVAAEGVREGGAIVLVAACEEGLGGDEYVAMLSEGASSDDLMQRIEGAESPRHDQWQIQCQAMVQARAEVHVHSLLSRQQTETAHVRYCEDVSGTVRELVAAAQARGLPGSVLVLPHGQLTVPVVG